MHHPPRTTMHVQSSALGIRQCPRSSAVIRQLGCLLGCHGTRLAGGLTARATSRITYRQTWSPPRLGRLREWERHPIVVYLFVEVSTLTDFLGCTRVGFICHIAAYVALLQSHIGR